MNRRQFNLTAMATVAGMSTGTALAKRAKPALKKALKYGMIGGGGSVEDRFRRALACGFLGVELVHILHQLVGRGDEVVPHCLDSDFHPGLLGGGDGLFNLGR